MSKPARTETSPTGKVAKAIESASIVPDFLPSPSELVASEEMVKVTIEFHRSSVEFFKREARANHVPYQAMVRQVVDLYANHWGGEPADKDLRRPVKRKAHVVANGPEGA
jgi:hypothetical protein